MAAKISVEMVRGAIADIEYPTISYNLIDLGMIRDITIKGRFVIITMALPFTNMTIKDDIFKSLEKPIKKLGGALDLRTTTMSQVELKKYLALEMQNPKGDI